MQAEKEKEVDAIEVIGGIKAKAGEAEGTEEDRGPWWCRLKRRVQVLSVAGPTLQVLQEAVHSILQQYSLSALSLSGLFHRLL